MKQGLSTSNVYMINSQFGETIPLSVTSSSSNVKFGLNPSILNYDVIVTNAGTKTAFINFGVGSTTAAAVPAASGNPSIGTGTIGTPILPGAIYTFQKNSDAVKADTCAAICGGTDTTTLYFTSVQGS